MKKWKAYLSGDFIETKKLKTVINPYTNKAFAEYYCTDSSHLKQAILKAESVQEEMALMPSHQKYSILMKIADRLKERKNEMAEIICQEAGKPMVYAAGEVDRACQTFIVAAEESKRIPGEYISIDWTAAGEKKEGIVRHFPVGVVGGISPFNFPLNLAAHKIAPAIAAGCPIILKPSSSTPLAVLLLAEIIDQTELPKGAVSFLPMDRETGNLLVKDERIKLLSFTGSPEVGWGMKKDAGKKKLVLELGGNAGLIIAESADIDKAIERSVIGGFAYSGQVCIHTQRIYIHKNIFNEFAEKFSRKAASLIKGDPMDIKTQISNMIDEKNAIRVEEWVREAIEEGAQLHTGGKRKGTFFEPTVLSQTHKEMKVCSREIFGPVVVLEAYTSFSEAIDWVNEGRYGLQAGVFTNHIDEMNEAFHRLHVGGVMINEVPTFRVDHMPYGGIKDSGIGREGVKYAIKDMLEEKIMIKPAF